MSAQHARLKEPLTAYCELRLQSSVPLDEEVVLACMHRCAVKTGADAGREGRVEWGGEGGANLVSRVKEGQ